MSTMPEWVYFVPILLSFLSFSIFFGEVRHNRNDSSKPFTIIGIIFLAFGFVGLIGSAMVIYVNYKSDIERTVREAKILENVTILAEKNIGLMNQLDNLSSQNENLRVDQKKLMVQNGTLVSLVNSLTEKVSNQSNTISSLDQRNKDIQRKNNQIEARTRKIQQESELARELAEEQLEHAEKIRRIAEDQEKHEKSCQTILALYPPNSTMARLNGCR